jgi:lipid-binding SYLF domain-containing protein
MDTVKVLRKSILPFLAVLAFVLIPAFATPSHAKSAREIDEQVHYALQMFKQQVPDAGRLLHSAKGVLVIPNEVKFGLGIGGEYGEGALLVHGKTVGYYNIAGGNIGLIAGADEKNLVLLFMDQAALDHFRYSPDWTAASDKGITYITNGREDYDNVFSGREPVVAIAFGQRGLIADLSIEGAKFSRMIKRG